MGAVSSTPNSPPVDPVVVNNEVTLKIKEFSSMIDNIEKSNFDAFNSYIDGTSLKKEEKEKIKTVLQQTKQIFGQIDRNQTSDGIIKQMNENSPLRKEIEALMQTEYFKSNNEVASKFKRSLQTLADINAQYRYFVYNYVHLNAFIPLIFDAVTQIIEKSFVQMVSVINDERKQTEEIIKNIDNVITASFTHKDAKGNDITTQFPKEWNDIQRNMFTKFKTLAEKTNNELLSAKTKSIEDLVKFILQSTDGFKGVVNKDGGSTRRRNKPATVRTRAAANTRKRRE